MINKNSLMTRLSILAISLLLTSAMSINGALPQMQKALGMTTTQVELVATLPALAVVIFVILSNLIAEKIGTKKTVQLGLLLVGLGGGVAPLVLDSYALLLISRFILGAGFGLFNSLAVSIINLLFQNEPQERAALLGYRGAAENIGNAGLTLLAGFMMAFGWRFAFTVYLLAFPILILFTIFVPEIQQVKKESHEQQGELKFSVYLLALFALFLVMTFVAIGVRFPTMVTNLKGANYNASAFLAVMPLIGIVTGSLFGFFNHLLGEKCLYLGLALLACATFLIAISENNFTLLLMGYFISGIPGSLIFPFIYNSLNLYATPTKMTAATSIILIGCNLGNFIAPFGLSALQFISGTKNLFAPFQLLSILLLAILAGIFLYKKKPFLRKALSGGGKS
ncbi:MFS transporter [Enterococcus sp. MJM12]|uniref:MFS transporter n=1 Tax=Candidatus Enterococcus myersii TaxID=2815322 RepID=A0ABS3H498_9ENTE|nr:MULTISPECIES: MFS transporter [Enterococcus]MBO0448284.1 MFS transporter [Enterococcus sp. MJM12]MDT2739454.1 MFS transporter [Enterococcus canintestini]WHA09899.1 MFS transporter [Enterococcus montenegrensis]